MPLDLAMQPNRDEAAAVQWLGRMLIEQLGIDLHDAGVALEALDQWPATANVLARMVDR